MKVILLPLEYIIQPNVSVSGAKTSVFLKPQLAENINK